MTGGWVERAQLQLGTLVSVGVRGDVRAGDQPDSTLDLAFAAIARVHRLMSFHAPDSDVSRLNREAATSAVRIDPSTMEVLRLALELSAATRGAFDVSIAPQLVARRLLPAPPAAPGPDPKASWRDIEILDDEHVRFHRPLWIDLGGIAKGQAVDAAFARLPNDPRRQRRVNAGGDLRVAGPDAERVLLKIPHIETTELPVIELTDGSVASSATTPADGAHVDGRGRAPCAAGQFVSVVADSCIVADALTKVVLALGAESGDVLASYRATAHWHTSHDGWRTVGAPS